METFSASPALREREFTGQWMNSTQKGRRRFDVFVWSAPEQTVEQTIKVAVIVIYFNEYLIEYHGNETQNSTRLCNNTKNVRV